MRNYLCLIYFFQFLVPGFSQNGGTSTYNFLKIPVSARSAASGGLLISVNDSDLSLVIDNPSLLNPGMNNYFSFSYINYLADINQGFVSFAKNIKSIGTISAGINYLNYGKFTETDVYDQKSGEFSAGEYALNLSFSKKLHPNFNFGGTVKGIYSHLYEYKSSGLAADIAGTFSSINNSLVSALVIKNLGSQISTYNLNIREPLPFEIMLGISKKIKYAPIRLTFNLRNLQKWKLASDDLISIPVKAENNEMVKKIYSAGYHFALHSSAGIELMPVKGFCLRLGYDHKRRKEMDLAERSGLTGFSLGFGIRILKMNLNYSRASYHFAGASNHLTLIVNPFEFAVKKNKTVLFEKIDP